jgi:hypothetical protein
MGTDITEFSRPGVFKVVCIPKNCALFVEAEGSIFRIHSAFFDTLYDGTCPIPELLEDWKLYGRDQFDSDFVVYGPEFYNREKRLAALEKAKQEWTGSLYPPLEIL